MSAGTAAAAPPRRAGEDAGTRTNLRHLGRPSGHTSVYGAAGLACLVLSILVLGIPGTLVLAGTWLLAAAFARGVPGLSGPVSWAAAIVAEAVLLTGLSAGLATLSPHTHGRPVDLAVLAIPAVLGIAGWSWALTRRLDRRAERVPSRGPLPLAVAIVVLGAAKWISSLGRDDGLAWAMSGDARNHVLISRTVLADGGLTSKELHQYPALINNLIALIAGAGGRTGLPAGQLLLHDAQALATTYVLGGIATAVMLVAALLEVLPRRRQMVPRLSAGAVLVLLACAATSASPLVLGTALNGGFVTAYAALPVGIASMVLALRFLSEPSPASFSLLGPAAMVLLFAWTPLAVVPMALVVVTGLVGLARWRRAAGAASGASGASGGAGASGASGGAGASGASGGIPALRWPRGLRWDWIVSVVVSVGAFLTTMGVAIVGWSSLRSQFATPGAIAPPQTRLLYVLALLAVGIGLATRRRTVRIQMVVPLAVAVGGELTVKWLASLPASGVVAYYSIKSLWLLASCLLWLAFVPAITAVTGERRSEIRRGSREVIDLVQGAAWSGVVLLVLGFSTTVANPLTVARSGWDQPSAPVVAETAAAADSYPHFVLWQWSDPGNDRLGDFWAALAWDSTPSGDPVPLGRSLPEGLEGWDYLDSGLLPQLCTLTKAVPHLVVITRNPSLRAQLSATCPQNRARVVVTSAASHSS